MEFIFNGRGKADRTQHEKIAMRNIKGAINYIVGGYYNDYQDGNYEYLPESREQLEAIIYNEAMNCVFGDGYCGANKAPKEMRFAGTEFCEAYITWKLDQDEDVKVIGEAAGWNERKEESEGNQMSNKERFLISLGTIIKSGEITPIERYYNHDDWYLGNEIWDRMEKGFCLAPYEMKELSDKPALIQRMEFVNALHENHTVYRMTKAGWKRYEELTADLPKEEPKTVEQPSEKKEEPIEKPEKLQKILDYVPWCKADAIYSCWKDSDGYWIELNEGWNADRMDHNCRTIHETTIYDLKYQIGGIRKVAMQ